MSKTSSAVKDRYNRKTYDQILFRLPKGGKDWIKESASQKGYTSVNEFLTDAVKAFVKD